MKYKLVAQSEADLKTGKISVDSPIGKGLLGKTRKLLKSLYQTEQLNWKSSQFLETDMASIFQKIVAGRFPHLKYMKTIITMLF